VAPAAIGVPPFFVVVRVEGYLQAEHGEQPGDGDQVVVPTRITGQGNCPAWATW